MSVIGMVPVFGDAMTGAKLLNKGGKAAAKNMQKGNAIVEQAAKNINQINHNAKGVSKNVIKKGGTDATERAEQLAAVRAKNIGDGIPANILGPSGKPKIIIVKHPAKKIAKEAALKDAGKGGSVMHHPSPTVGNPHYHPVKPNGVKVRTHHEYPPN